MKTGAPRKIFALAAVAAICLTFLLRAASCSGGGMDAVTHNVPPSSAGSTPDTAAILPTGGEAEQTLGSNASVSGAGHFFRQQSTWYEPIPADARVAANSVLYVDRVRRNSTLLSAAYKDWTVPVFYAQEDTTPVPVPVKKTTLTEWNTVPIPPEALPDMNTERCAGRYSDGHMVVVSADRHWAWDFYQASRCNGIWKAAWIRRWDLTTDGVNQPYDGQGSCRVAKVPLLQGLITYNEVVNEGAINHAIAFATWSNAASTGWYPTHISTVESADDKDPWANILGMRYQLDPGFNCEVTGWNNFNKIVCRALQKYGMIYVENAGRWNNAIYAENLVNKPVSWDGIITSAIPVPWDRMRIVEPVLPKAGPGAVQGTSAPVTGMRR